MLVFISDDPKKKSDLSEFYGTIKSKLFIFCVIWFSLLSLKVWLFDVTVDIQLRNLRVSDGKWNPLNSTLLLPNTFFQYIYFQFKISCQKVKFHTRFQTGFLKECVLFGMTHYLFTACGRLFSYCFEVVKNLKMQMWRLLFKSKIQRQSFSK